MASLAGLGAESDLDLGPHRFNRARRAVFATVELVSRYWIATLVSTEETSTQVRVVLDQALAAQGLDEQLTEDRLDLDPDDPDRSIVIAVPDDAPR